MLRAVELLRSIDGRCELAVTVNKGSDDNLDQVRTTRRLGVKVLPSIISHPSRGINKDQRQVIDSGWIMWKMRLRAAGDLIQSLLLLLPSSSLFSRPLLGKECNRSYNYLRRCDAVVVRGGGFIYAHNGLYWAYFLWFALFPLLLAQRCGVPVIILPNSFGPFGSRWSRRLTGKITRACKIIIAREPLSLDILKQIQTGQPLIFPDMAFELLPADASWALSELKSQGVAVGEKICVGITMRPWRFPLSKTPLERFAAYLEAFAAFLEYLITRGYKPILFAHSSGPHSHEDDRIALKAALKLSSAGEDVLFIEEDYDCRELAALYGKMDYMVCTRFHSAIFSIVQNVPCIAISYQGHKTIGIMGELDLKEFVIPIEDVMGTTLNEKFERLLREERIVKDKMKAYMETSGVKSDEMRSLITEELSAIVTENQET